MKIKLLLPALVVCAALFTPAFAKAADKKHKSEADLMALAKVTKVQATEIALKKVPGGKVESGELEEEKGALIWSFDIATPGTKDITEVAVDAKTGAVISVEKETPKDQAAEKKADKKELKKHGKKEQDVDGKDEQK